MPFQASTTHNSDNLRGNFRFQYSANNPAQGEQEDMNALTDPLDIIQNKLEKKDLFLNQEIHFRTTAENDSHVYLEQIKEVENLLEAECQINLTCEKDLNQCKDIIEEMHQSCKMPEQCNEAKSKYAEAQKLVLHEIEHLKKQLEEETTSNRELCSKLHAQEAITQSLEFKSTELRV